MTRPLSPRTDVPDRVPRSVRRRLHVDFAYHSLSDVEVTGACRDEVTGADGGTSLAEVASVKARAEHGRLTACTLEPHALDTDQLLGEVLARGLRAKVRELADLGGTSVGQLLDDVAGASIASGYVTAFLRTQTGELLTRAPDPQDAAPARYVPSGPATGQANLCSGWRDDGMMMLSIRARQPMPFLPLPRPPVRMKGDDGWPHSTLPRDSLRRSRRIDVVLHDDRWVVDAWFRDTNSDSDCVPGAVHEYTLDAVVDPTTHEIREIVATPHALPWHECPAAAGFVDLLVGVPVEELRTETPHRLRGLQSCTHLTNALRALADVAYLAEHP